MKRNKKKTIHHNMKQYMSKVLKFHLFKWWAFDHLSVLWYRLIFKICFWAILWPEHVILKKIKSVVSYGNDLQLHYYVLAVWTCYSFTPGQSDLAPVSIGQTVHQDLDGFTSESNSNDFPGCKGGGCCCCKGG